jgi:hypothetical protein
MGHLECAQALGFYYEHGLGKQPGQAGVFFSSAGSRGTLPSLAVTVSVENR